MRDGKSTKEKIISVAMQIFAQRGYEGTTLDEIAKFCNITKPAIYYHFKDKSALYEYILCSQFEEMAKRVLSNTTTGTPKERLRAYIINYGKYLIENPTFSAIFSREISAGGKTLPSGCVEELAKTLKRLEAILNDGFNDGVFEEENPFLIQMMIVTPLSAYHTTRSLREKVASVSKSQYLSVEFDDIVKKLADKVLKSIEV